MRWMDFERPRNLPKWFLTTVAELDFNFQPGLLAKLLRSSPHRRHTVAALIAICFPDRFDSYHSKASEMAQELASGRLGSLLQRWLPISPQGFLRALGRMNEDIENPDFYRKLFNAYSDPDRRDVVRALRHIRGLNSRMLSIVMGAPSSLLWSGGWQLVRNESERDDLVAAISTIKEYAGATDVDISRSLTAALDHGSVTKFVQGWLGRASLPAPPDIGHPMIRPILTAAELRRAALEFQNCMAGYLLDALSGKDAFYLMDSPVHGRMVARISQDDVEAPWRLTGVHMKRNRTPTFAASQWVAEQFASVGIRPQHLRRPRGAKWAVIERLLDPVYYDLDDTMDDWEA